MTIEGTRILGFEMPREGDGKLMRWVMLVVAGDRRVSYQHTRAQGPHAMLSLLAAFASEAKEGAQA